MIRMSDRPEARAALAQSQLSVLVVDEDQALREDLRRALCAHGCWVDTAATGSEALRYVLVRNYHVVVSSFSLPLVDGLELTRLLSRRIQSPRIVLICGNDDPTWVKEAFDAGASRVLPKPLAAPALAELVEKLGSPD
jgi:CheY-like chemotaxis protein